MKKLMQKFLALILVLAMCLSAGPAWAAETASVIRLSKTEGTVAVTNSGGKSLTKRDDMRLYNGNHVSTQEKSYAWISLDDEKLNKLDEDSEAELRKSKRLLEVLLNKGNLFFNVTAPLEEEESLNIRTSTMVVGIRGTCGWVKVLDQRNTEVYILEGRVWCTITDPVSGQSKTTVLSGGESARFTVYDREQNGERCGIIRDRFAEGDIDGFVLAELVGDAPMCDKIFEDSGLDLRQLTQEQVRDRLQADQAANAEKIRLREELEARKENNVSIEPVWGNSAPSEPSSGPSGGSGASAPPFDGVVRLTMPVTDMQVQQSLNRTDATQVVVSPEAGNAGVPLDIGIDMNVAPGKTLTLESGVPAEVQGGLQVDGTADLRDNLNNLPGGSITVTSGDTLRVGGNLNNQGSMTVTASGRSVTEGTVSNTGSLSLTDGARVLSRGGFVLTAAVDGWRVAPELSDGYYILETYVPQKSTLTLNFNNGDTPGTVETDSDGRLTAPLPTPTDPDGGTFKGWFTEDGTTDPAKQVTDDTVFTGDTTIYAVWERVTGDFKVTGGGSGDYSFARDGDGYGTLTVSSAAPLTVSMKDGVTQTTTDHIYIADGVSANITLDGVDISLSRTEYIGDTMNGIPAIEIEDGSTGNVTVTLKGINRLFSGFYCAGLQKNGGASTGLLTVKGSGRLTAGGGAGGAGIGGSIEAQSYNITIALDDSETAAVEANGGYAGNGVLIGAGIGSGSDGESGNITISGGTVTVKGGEGHGEGIGGDSSCKNVTISGGTLNGTVTASGDFVMNAGTLNGSVTVYSGTFTMTGGEVDGDVRVSGGTFTMSGGTVNGHVEVGNGSFTMTGGVIDCGDVNSTLLLWGDWEAHFSGGSIINSLGEYGYAVYVRADTDVESGFSEPIETSIRSKGDLIYWDCMEWPHSFVPAGYRKAGPDSDDYYYLAPDNGDFVVTSGVKGTDYSFERDAASGLGTLTILTAKPMTISMAEGVEQTARDRIYIADGVSANITLDEVKIDLSATPNATAFKIEDGSTGNVTVMLAGSNKLASGNYCAGLQKNGSSGTLTINGTGVLDATGGRRAAGIGGGDESDGVGIIITDGTVTATGMGINDSSGGAAGIGGGYMGSGRNIQISGGTVTANAGPAASAIGGGVAGNGMDITISGNAKVTAVRTGSSSACIGGGYQDRDGNGGGTSNIAVSDSALVTLIGTNDRSPGIGAVNGTPAAGITIDSTATVRGDSTNLVAPLPAGYTVAAPGEEGDGYYYFVPNTDTGDFLVTGGTAGTDYIFDRDAESGLGRLTVKGSEPLTISMAEGVERTARDRIYIADGVSANITLDGVNVQAYSAQAPAFQIADNSKGNVVVTLVGENSLVSGDNHAGLEKDSDKDAAVGKLTIQGSGTLTATGDDCGAGIGGGQGQSTANIEITGGTVKANGGDKGGGIGGGSGAAAGEGGDGSYITISGGDVTAAGTVNNDVNGAGIGGGGHGGSGHHITITGGTVNATGGGSATNSNYGGAGIGGGTGSGNSGHHIEITGGTVIAAGGAYAAGIGGGYDGPGTDIVISGTADVNASSIKQGAGIGGGGYREGSSIKILGDSVKVNATGGSGNSVGGGAGIGGGGFGGIGSDITITGGEVTAVCGGDGAGIGGGLGGIGSNIEISGGIVTANASGNSFGAGIGGGGGAVSWNGVIYEDGHGIGITISGGKVTATSAHGAGIGGGSSGTGSDITITGTAEVIAITEGCGAGIGGGMSASGSDITISGNAKVTATSNNGGPGATGAASPIGGGGTGTSIYDVKVVGSNITISDHAQVTVFSGHDAPGIGGGQYGAGENIKLEGGAVNGDIRVDQGTLTVSGGTLTGYVSISGGTFTKTGGDIRTKDNTDPTPPGWKWEDTQRDGEYYYLIPNPDTGDFTVTGGAAGTDYIFDRNDYSGWGTLTILTAEPMIISMAEGVPQTDRDHIYIADGVSANITLDRVNIDVSENGGSALQIANDSMGNVTITVSGDNELTGGQGRAAVEKVSGADSGTLTIQGDGTLKATGGDATNIGGHIFAGGGAGIGTVNGADTANIVIAGNVQITAYSVGDGYGIGGSGLTSTCHSLTIRGGTVNGTLQGGDVAVSGGTVNGSVDVSSGTFTMTGGTLTGRVYIGSSSTFSMSGGTLTGYVSISGGTFTKNGGDIKTKDNTDPTPAGWKWGDAQGADGYYHLVPETSVAAGGLLVEGGTPEEDYHFDETEGVLQVLTSTPITISSYSETDSTIFVKKDVDADITLAGVDINVGDSFGYGNVANYKTAFQVEKDSSGHVTVTLKKGSRNVVTSGIGHAGLEMTTSTGVLTIQGEGELIATGGMGSCAGIGSGYTEAGDCTIVINGGMITAIGSSANVTTSGSTGGRGYGGAGIGTSKGNADITIHGGTITAYGGKLNAYGAEYGNVGIGTSGDVNSTAVIVIDGGTVEAFGNVGIGNSSSASSTRSTVANVTITGGNVTATGIKLGIGSLSGGYGGRVASILIDCEKPVTVNSGVLALGCVNSATDDAVEADTTGWKGTIIVNGESVVYPKEEETP